MKEYVMLQSIYASLVEKHEDALDEGVEILIDNTEIVENSKRYFESATFPLVYPAKSYGVAVVYAFLIERLYGYPILETLNDPDLFLGTDPYFVTYEEDPESYDAIISYVKNKKDWEVCGWVPQTIIYFNRECTQEGLDSITNEIYKET